jgi:hypothetical protein
MPIRSAAAGQMVPSVAKTFGLSRGSEGSSVPLSPISCAWQNTAICHAPIIDTVNFAPSSGSINSHCPRENPGLRPYFLKESQVDGLNSESLVLLPPASQAKGGKVSVIHIQVTAGSCL